MKQFMSNNSMVKEIMRGLTLSNSLFVSSIIIGEAHTGKKSMLKSLYPNMNMIDASTIKNIEDEIRDYNEIIILNFHQIPNPDRIDWSNKKIIATAQNIYNKEFIDEVFAFIYHMPPLRERPEDIELYCKYFIEKASDNFGCNISNIDIDCKSLDLSDNIKGLKRQIFREVFSMSMDRNDIENTLLNYFSKKENLDRGYRDNLSIFEIPLIKAGLKLYGSQLKLANVLGINRNTLRKKINEYDID